MNEVTSLDAEFARLDELWSPRVVARVNDQYVKVASIEAQLAR